ncbi:MAG: alpha-amylase family glycosyl hydrolase [Brevinematia bacterium]
MKRIFIITILFIIFLAIVSCQKMPTIEDIPISSSQIEEVQDTGIPLVVITSPKEYQIVPETFLVNVFVVDNEDIERVVIMTPSTNYEIKKDTIEITRNPRGFVYTSLSKEVVLSSGGTNEIKVFARDGKGNLSLTNYLKIIVDTQNPTIGVIGFEHITEKVVSTNVQVSVFASDDTFVESIFISVNNSGFLEVSKPGSVFSTNLSFADNTTNRLGVYSKDAVGRISTIKYITLVVSANVPVIEIKSPSNNVWVNTSNIIVSGQANVAPGASIQRIYINVNNTAWEELPNPQQNWMVAKTIPTEGSNIVIKAKVIDDQNRESSESLVVIGVDWTPPQVQIVYPQNGFTVDQSIITANGTASDNLSGIKIVQVRLNDGNYEDAIGLGNWSKMLSLQEGTNVLYAKAIDNAGNIREVSIYLYKQTNGVQPPTSGVFPGDGPEDPRDWRVYFVMVDRFVDGYSGNNNIYGDEYRTPNNDSDEALRYYNGGDFKGLIDNLDYIKEMGFNAIWITPVVKQPEGRYVNSSQTYDAAGYHGYWGYDFDSIDPHLESPGATYDDLIREAHNRGIKIIQDIVPNHAHGGDAHPSVKWYNNRLKVKFDNQWWEYNQATDPYYNNTNGVSGIWESSPGFFNYRGDYKLLDLLDFNECDPRTRQHIINVYKRFIDRGVDGFRIDTVAYMRKEWWGLFADAMWEYAASKGKPWFWQVGEAWVATRSEALSYTTYSTRGAFSILDLHGSCMDFPGQAKGVFAGGSGFEQMANIMSSDYSGAIDPTFLGTFVDNHDKPRFPGGYYDSDTMVRIWKNALNWYFLARGIPIVYYGTEFEGTSDSINDYGAGEPKNRRYVGQSRINNARNYNYPIYRHLKLLNKLREAEIALRRGSQVNIHLQGDLAVFRREYVSSVAYVLLNKGSANQNYTVSLPNGSYLLLVPSGDVIVTNNVTVSSGTYNVSVQANSFSILVYNYPPPASSVSIFGSYSTSMTRVVGNLWRGTINVSSPGSVNVKFNVTWGTTNKTFGDNDEIGTFLPVSGTAIESSSDPITFDAPVVGPYQVEFNDATLSYTIKYVGTIPITTIIVRSFVGGNNWVGVCGSYSPPTSYSDPDNKVPGMAWWGNEPSTPMVFKGVDSNNRNIWVWVSTNVPSGKKIEFKMRRNGVDWYPGANLSVLGGQSADVTYDWGLTSNEGSPSTIDTNSPTVSIAYPTNNQVIVNQSNITIYGNASDDRSGVNEVRISINGSPFVLASGTTSWSYTTNLNLNTTNNVRVYAKDVSNNISVTNSVNFVITNIPSSGITINYFNTSWSSVNVHYNGGSGWTTVPGVSMNNVGGGWWRKDVDALDKVDFVFNNGSVWDNNNGKDYVSMLSWATNIYVSNSIVNLGNVSTVSAPVNVKIRYYRPDWANVYIHYYNGSGWTTSPGVAMTSEGNGWWVKEINVVGSYYEIKFNNGNGTWDNNGGVNYKANIGFTNIVIKGVK